MEESHILTEEPRLLEAAILKLPYIPDFLIEEVLFWFAPTRAEPTEVYLELTGAAAKNWQSYYTKKGWRFIHTHPRAAEGPFRVKSGSLDLQILEPGRIFSPKPVFHFQGDSKSLPVVSLEKQRPINPWKPNYIQALNFIRRYEWPRPLPRAVNYAIWEIEECGQVAGSVSWRNGEEILRHHFSADLRETLVDIFYNRPEDYPLGSEVYLRVLGRADEEGFKALLELAEHPVTRKRKVVANTLGAIGRRDGVPTLLMLLDDEDPDVRTAALRALGKVGVDPSSDPEGKVSAYLQSAEVGTQVWAAQALIKGGDATHEKALITMVKESPRLLTDMGELGDVLADLSLYEAVPFLINRLKHEKSEFRADAAEALSRVTGLNLEYQSLDTEDQRRSAIKTYSRWWDEFKRKRRTERE